MSYSFVAFLVLSHLDLVCLADPLSLLVYLHLGACWAHTLSVYSPVVLFILPQMWPHIDNPKSKKQQPQSRQHGFQAVAPMPNCCCVCCCIPQPRLQQVGVHRTIALKHVFEIIFCSWSSAHQSAPLHKKTGFTLLILKLFFRRCFCGNHLKLGLRAFILDCAMGLCVLTACKV